MLGLYVHIPFCVKKCNYCDFLSFPYSEQLVQSYVKALEKEIYLYGRSGKNRLASLYFGGGTPSLLAEKDFLNIFKAIRDCFILTGDTEVTVEANPGTLSAEKAKLLADLGVNRFSLGVQSFNQQDLYLMGRIYEVEEVAKAVRAITDAGVENYSLDIIGGLPGQTLRALTDNIEKSIKLKPKHLSLYGLKIERFTPWGELEEKGSLELPNEDAEAEMMSSAREILINNGYARYEISNFALSNFESRHNMRYWLNEEYIGVGLGASSYYKGERYSNETKLNFYLKMLASDVFPITVREKINLKLELAETVFLGLRLVSGIELKRFKKRFNNDVNYFFGDIIEKNIAYGLLEMTPSHLRLTSRGLEIANTVMTQFLS